jgi:neutral amino acid transport system substrate-binding protein
MNVNPLIQRMNLRNWKAIALTTLILSLGMLTAACQEASEPPKTGGTTGTSPQGSPADGSKSLKLGSLLPSTGDLAALGQPMIASVPVLVKTVNACGGVNGAPVELVQANDQTDPSAGTEAMTKLVTVDKVAGVVGSFGSSVSMAAAAVAARKQVMLISPGSTSPDFTSKAKNFQGFWARTAPSDAYQAPALAKLAYDRGFRKVATIVINNDYGVAFEKEFVNAFKKLGGTITNEAKPVRYDPKAASLKSEAAAAFQDKPDAVAAIMYGETGSLILKSAYEQGVSQGIPILLTDGMYDDALATKVGKGQDGKFIAAGVLGTIPGASGTALTEFTKIWETELKRPVEAYAAHSWDAAALLALAAEAAKTNSGEGIKTKMREVANAPGEEVGNVCKALELLRQGKDINYQGASGNVDIDENGDVIGTYDVWEVKPDGKIAKVGNVK